MATKNEQVKPLSPWRLRSDEDEKAMSKQSKLQQRTYIQCCGCLTVLLIIPVVIIIVIFAAFQVKNPHIKVNSITIPNMTLVFSDVFGSDRNITLVADLSVKNPNVASLKYSNTTSIIYYGGIVVGEGKIPPGVAKSKRTVRMNVSVDIIPKKILDVPSFATDTISGVLSMSSYTRIHGKVKIMKIIQKSVVVKINCTVTYNISSGVAQNNC